MESVIGGKTDGTKELVESWKSIVDAIVLDIVEFEGGWVAVLDDDWEVIETTVVTGMPVDEGPGVVEAELVDEGGPSVVEMIGGAWIVQLETRTEDDTFDIHEIIAFS